MDNRSCRESGQATVEFALSLPFIIVFSLCVVQIGSVANDQLALSHAARVAAREISLADVDESWAQQVAIESIRREIDLEDLDVITELSPKLVTVDLKYRRRVDVPLIGVVVPVIELHATATMPREPSTN